MTLTDLGRILDDDKFEFISVGLEHITSDQKYALRFSHRWNTYLGIWDLCDV